MKLSKKGKNYNVERGFISKLLEEKDMKLLKDQQIKPSFFTGDNRRVYSFIQNQFSSTGEIPTSRVLAQKFPNYELEVHTVEGVEHIGTDESLLYWCNQLHIKSMHNRTADVVEAVAEKLDEGESEEAYAILKKGVWQIEDEVVISSSVDITKDTEDRKRAYLERKEKKGIMGIPTGIPHLDYILKGLVKETLTTLIANSGVGKTWFLILVGAYAQLNNYKVCVFITEMSTDLMRDRFEAMLFGMMCGDFDYNNFKSGTLPLETEQAYFEFLEDDLPKLEPLIIETATGVSSVVSVIEKEKPDLVLIDGVYLMEDEQGAKDDWLRVTHITRDLKKVAKNWHLPILINTQADKNTSKKTGPELGSIMYSQAIGQDSDNVLALFRDEVMINDREMGVKVLKQREGVLGKVLIQWDFNRMNFDSIYSESSGDNAEQGYTDEEYEGNIMSVN
jgi:replicative DNA helicase